MVGGGVRGDGCDIDGGDDVILQRGEAALQEDGGGGVGDRDKYAAEQVAVADVERDAGGGDQADAANRWRTVRRANRRPGRARI